MRTMKKFQGDGRLIAILMLGPRKGPNRNYLCKIHGGNRKVQCAVSQQVNTTGKEVK